MLHRLKEYIDYKNIKISTFEKSLGMANASLATPLRKGGSIGANKLKTIHAVYPDLNLMWLITGKGEMLNKPEGKTLYPNLEEETTSSILNEAPVDYKNRMTIYEKAIENLNYLIQEKDACIRKKEQELQEKEKQIAGLRQLLLLNGILD